MEATISGSRAPDMVELSVDRKKPSLASVKAVLLSPTLRGCDQGPSGSLGEMKDPVWCHRTGAHTV